MRRAGRRKRDVKEQNQIEWVVRMNNIRNRAEEVVCNEVLFK
ncbi:MAG: TnpV protein [Oscillospiraceae bacterium]|nr:TnpV protein [Oscillospiraceae bacterium]